MDQNFMVGWLVNLWHWCSDFEAYFHELVIFEVPLKKAPVWFGYPRGPFCGPKKVRKSRPVTWASPVDRWAARLIEAEKKWTCSHADAHTLVPHNATNSLLLIYPLKWWMKVKMLKLFFWRVESYPLVNIHKTIEHLYFQLKNSPFLWPCSIAILNYQRYPKVNHGRWFY